MPCWDGPCWELPLSCVQGARQPPWWCWCCCCELRDERESSAEYGGLRAIGGQAGDCWQCKEALDAPSWRLGLSLFICAAVNGPAWDEGEGEGWLGWLGWRLAEISCALNEDMHEARRSFSVWTGTKGCRAQSPLQTHTR